MPPKKPKKQETTKPHQSEALAFVADVHIGNHKARDTNSHGGINERCAAALETLRQAIQQAIKSGAGTLIIGGDLVHSRRPEPAIIAAINRVLQTEADRLGVVIIPGNHEMLDATAEDGNTACAPLYPYATVINTPEWVPIGDWAHVLCIPFEGRIPMAEHIARTVTSMSGKGSPKGHRVLATHVGVYDDTAPPWLKGRDAIHAETLLALLEANDISLALVGNFHHHNDWSRNGHAVIQVGTLAPASYSDAGVFPNVGGMVLHDGPGSTDLVEVPGPRFLTEDIRYEAVAEKAPEGCLFHVRSKSPVGVLPNTKVEVDLLDDTPEVQRPDLPQVQDAGEALTSYVTGMDLPDDVPRDGVLSKVQALWSEAAGQ